MSGRVWQVIPVLHSDDAAGNQARRIAELLGDRHAGFIVEHADPQLRALTTEFTSARVEAADVLFLHFVLASSVGEWVTRTNAIKAMDYHNITPPEFFRAYDPGLATALNNARIELDAHRAQTALAVAHSEYSREELERAGFSRTENVPLFVDFGQYDREPNSALLNSLTDSKKSPGDVLFVGRIAPNKRQEDVIKAFAVYRRLYQPDARLFLVGGTNSAAYSRTLEEFVGRMGIEEVNFVGRASVQDLIAYYRAADVFVSMSEHEGFGAPVLEAMHLGVPVVAYAAAAIPEVVGNAGILFDEKRYEEIAAAIDLVVSDGEVRSHFVEAGRGRVRMFDASLHEPRLTSLIEELL